MAALTTYGTNAATSTLPTASKLATASGGTGGTSTIALGLGLGYGELPSQGTAAAWPSLGAIGAPTGNGWLLDNTSLALQTLLAGNWTPEIKSKVSVGSFNANIFIRAFAYDTSALTYTPIGVMELDTQTWTTAAAFYTFVATLLASFTFNATQRLYYDCWLNVYANSTAAGSTITLNLATTGAAGVANVMQMTTPGFVTLSSMTSEDDLVVSDSFQAVQVAINEDDVVVLDSFVAVQLSSALDALSADDSASLFGQIILSTDALSPSDSFQAIQVAWSVDVLPVTDSFTPLALLLMTSTDALVATDSFQAVQILQWLENLAVSDSFQAVNISLSTESLSPSDTFLMVQIAQSVDALTATDAFLALQEAFSTDVLTAADALLMVEVVQWLESLVLSDSLSWTEIVIVAAMVTSTITLTFRDGLASTTFR